MTTAPQATVSSAITEKKFHDTIHHDIGDPKKSRVRVDANNNGKKESVPRDHNCPWAETVVNLTSKTVNVKVYLNFESKSRTGTDLAKLKKLASAGIGEYWSRQITVAGQRFRVLVDVLERKTNAMDVRLKISEGKDYARSHNSGIVDAAFIYNKGFYKAFPGEADRDFKMVCAHEFGHSVLEFFGGRGFSWGHKGSTHALLQKTKKSTPGYPAKGEIDLMKYYNDKKSTFPIPNRYSRTRAAENDIKRLIWMSNISF